MRNIFAKHSCYFPQYYPYTLPHRNFTNATTSRMPSSKGTPTDPELREEVKEEVKAMEKG